LNRTFAVWGETTSLSMCLLGSRPKTSDSSGFFSTSVFLITTTTWLVLCTTSMHTTSRDWSYKHSQKNYEILLLSSLLLLLLFIVVDAFNLYKLFLLNKLFLNILFYVSSGFEATWRIFLELLAITTTLLSQQHKTHSDQIECLQRGCRHS
jgi:hypothetical protein